MTKGDKRIKRNSKTVPITRPKPTQCLQDSEFEQWNGCCHNSSLTACYIRVVDIHVMNDEKKIIFHSTISLRQGTHVTIPPRFPSCFQAFAGPIGPAINI